MDHIPLEIHMGLEIKGNCLTKCTALHLAQNVWIMGWIFLPNPEGHGFFPWIFSQTLWVLRFHAFENYIPCQDQLLSLSLLAPVPHHVLECAVMKERALRSAWKEWGAGGGWSWSCSLPFFLFCFLFFLWHFPFTLSILSPLLPYFVISFFPPHFFFFLSGVEEWIKIGCF